MVFILVLSVLPWPEIPMSEGWSVTASLVDMSFKYRRLFTAKQLIMVPFWYVKQGWSNTTRSFESQLLFISLCSYQFSLLTQ